MTNLPTLVRTGELEALEKYYEEHRADLTPFYEEVDTMGNTLLHLAADVFHADKEVPESKRLEIVKFLVEDVGLDAGKQNKIKQTPLGIATKKYGMDNKLVFYLAEAKLSSADHQAAPQEGADIDTKANAVSPGTQGVKQIKRHIKQGRKLEKLFFYIENGDFSKFREIIAELEPDTDLNEALDNDNNTLLIAAVKAGEKNITNFLLTNPKCKKIDPLHENHHGEVASDFGDRVNYATYTLLRNAEMAAQHRKDSGS